MVGNEGIVAVLLDNVSICVSSPSCSCSSSESSITITGPVVTGARGCGCRREGPATGSSGDCRWDGMTALLLGKMNSFSSSDQEGLTLSRSDLSTLSSSALRRS